jgi:hypothetical protein
MASYSDAGASDFGKVRRRFSIKACNAWSWGRDR